MVTESSLIGLYPRSRSGSSCGFILRCLAIRSRGGFGGLGKFSWRGLRCGRHYCENIFLVWFRLVDLTSVQWEVRILDTVAAGLSRDYGEEVTGKVDCGS